MSLAILEADLQYL